MKRECDGGGKAAEAGGACERCHVRPRLTRKMEVEGWWMVHLRINSRQVSVESAEAGQLKEAPPAAKQLPGAPPSWEAAPAQQRLTRRSGRWM